MKTIKNWFDEIPMFFSEKFGLLSEALKEKALKNLKPEKSGIMVSSMEKALDDGIDWSITEEGYEYWEYIWKNCANWDEDFNWDQKETD